MPDQWKIVSPMTSFTPLAHAWVKSGSTLTGPLVTTALHSARDTSQDSFLNALDNHPK